MAHLKAVLVQLARIHAFSYHMMETYEGGVTRFQKDYWTMNSKAWFNTESKEMADVFEMMSSSNFGMYLAALDKYLEDRELYKKLQKFDEHRSERVQAVHLATSEGFNCLLHNDAWCNNFMFK